MKHKKEKGRQDGYGRRNENHPIQRNILFIC